MTPLLYHDSANCDITKWRGGEYQLIWHAHKLLVTSESKVIGVYDSFFRGGISMVLCVLFSGSANHNKFCSNKLALINICNLMTVKDIIKISTRLIPVTVLHLLERLALVNHQRVFFLIHIENIS